MSSQNPDNSKQNLSSETSQYLPNLDPAHENPTELINYVEEMKQFEDEVQEQIDEMINQELEKEIMSEMDKARKEEIEEDSEDEDKWFPDYKDCKCCRGFVYNCQGETCILMGQCYCKMKDDIEQNEDKCDCDEKEDENNNKGAVMAN